MQPIGLETVPYTYDQGRDFLAARDIIVDKDITLIGPTTGAGGVYHGAWWYYFLAIPYVITSAHPLGFYYAIALLGFVQSVFFYAFLKQKVNPFIALLFISIVAVSPYFVRTSVFAINSVMTLPFILLLMYSMYSFFEKKSPMYVGLAGFSIGMIMESEVAFGAFLIPAFILAVVLSKSTKSFLSPVKNVFYGVGGFLIAAILRVTFELKNGFLQTKALMAFSSHPGTNPVSWTGALTDRLKLFRSYFNDIFSSEHELLGWVLLIVSLGGLYLGYRKFKDHQKKFVTFTGMLLVLLFLLSLLYKNSFFWHYYFEGIQYFFIVLMMMGLYGLILHNKKIGISIVGLYIAVFVIGGVTQVQGKIQIQEEIKNEGLLMHTKAIDHLYEQVGSDKFCLRIYTPPVIPHTYNYLLDTATRRKDMTYPRTVYIDKHCWYLIENDANQERRDIWLSNNIPDGAEKTHEHRISDNLIIQQWHYPVENTQEE